MISHGLNASGTDIGSTLNPGPVTPFDPSAPSRQVVADGAGIVLAAGDGASVTSLSASGAGVALLEATGAGSSVLDAHGAGIVQNAARPAES